jgi:hypothetical protein
MPSDISAMTKIMDSIIDYDTVKTLVANLPSIDPCPNFFNLRTLQTHFAHALNSLTFIGPYIAHSFFWLRSRL